MKLISSVKKELTSGDELELPAFKDVAKHFVDKSHYAIGLFSQVSLTEDTSLLFNVERHGERKGRRSKAMLLHKLPNHDVTLEAAWPEIFVDRNGTYWDVPSSVSLDIASLLSDSGLRYRFGIHKNGGHPEAVNSSSSEIPLTLMPGICAKAAFSYEKSRDFWREKDTSTKSLEVDEEPAWMRSYDVRLKEPHAAISGIIGGTSAAWFDGKDKKRNPFNVDMFGSICYTFQHGKFKNDFNDLSRIDARLSVYSASAFIKGFSDIFGGKSDREVDPIASPRLDVILQQQLAGPIVFRMDSRFSLGSSVSGKQSPRVEDVMYSLNYSLRALQSGKVVAWFSPKRKEAMVELRFFEF